MWCCPVNALGVYQKYIREKMTQEKICPFCTLSTDSIIDSSKYGVVIRHSRPATPGHTMIIPKRHVGSFFELFPDEHVDLMKLFDRAKQDVFAEFSAQSYFIGINFGEGAWRTVPHLHIHLIPRYDGYREDPRAGVQSEKC